MSGYPDPICQNCGYRCDTSEEVNTPELELWCYCPDCDMETFHPIPTKKLLNEISNKVKQRNNMKDSRTRLIRQTISLLSSMVEGGEQHSDQSKTFVRLANEALDGIENSGPEINPGNYSFCDDYELLYKKVSNGIEIAAFVDNTFSISGEKHVCRDICTIKKRKEHIDFGARGICYNTVFRDWSGGTEKERFVKACQRMNLKWIP